MFDLGGREMGGAGEERRQALFAELFALRAARFDQAIGESSQQVAAFQRSRGFFI